MAKEAKLIGVVSGKGGVGKTSVSINMGACLALLKKKTVLVDCNLGTSHLGIALGMHYCPTTLNDVMKGRAPLDEALYKHAPTGMTVLPASVKATNVEGIDVSQLRKIAKRLVASFEYVILDGGPGMGREAFATLLAADDLLYVSTPTLPSVMDVVRYKHALQSEHKNHLGIVLNMFDGLPHQLSVQDVEKMTQLEVICTIPTDAEVNKSQAAELPVAVFNKNARSSKAFRELALKIAGEYKPPAKNPGLKQIFEDKLRKIDELIGL